MIAVSIELKFFTGSVREVEYVAEKTGQAQRLARWPMFHRGRVTDSSGPAVLNANVVAVQNACPTWVRQPPQVTTPFRRLTWKPNHSRWKSPGVKVSRVTNVECVVVHSHGAAIVQTLENDTMSSRPVRRPRHAEARADVGQRELGQRRHSW